MKSTLSLRQIQHLEARVDEIAFRSRRDEEEDSTGMKVAKYGAAGTLGVGALYGAKRGADAFKSRYGYPDYDGKQMVNRQSFKKAGNDVVDAGAAALDKLKKSKGVTAGTKAWNRSAGQGFFKRAGRVISSGIQAVRYEAGPLDVTEFAALLAFEHPSQVSAKRKIQEQSGK